MILGIDQGTTGTTAVLMTKDGEPLGKATVDIPQHFPYPGWVEHDPKEILVSVEQAIRDVLKRTDRSATEIDAIGITNQRETVSLFDGTRPLHRFIVWQDRRTSDICKRLKRHEKTIRSRAGLPIDPYFSGTKIMWLMNKLKVSRTSKKIRFRTIDSFLINALTGEDAIEITNASRTSLLNIKTGKWDKELLKIHRIPESFCPEVVASEGMRFRTRGLSYLPDGIPVVAVLGDQQAALFGQNGWKKGCGKITFGTGSFILVNTGDKPVVSRNKLVSTVALQMASGKTSYALEGSAFICGAWIQFLRDQLGLIETAPESETLARSVENSGGVKIIPALSGMGAPFWKADMRGSILGLTRGSGKGEIARASLEALAFQNRALIDAMKKDTKLKRLNLKVDGGAVANGLLMQIQANALGAPIVRPKNLEATGFGVSLLAALSKNYLNLSDIEQIWKKDREFKPERKDAKNIQKLYDEWLKIVKAA